VSAPPEVRSPFHLLEEAEEAKELLILSYTTSLDFFERFALSRSRALGALVTVISDAAMVGADPVVVRRAGAAYLDARAVCPGGAFHPKLFVLVGESEARVGIGSGNLTMAGWHGNAELLTILRSDGDGGPTTMSEVASFLRRLADSSVTLSPGAREALERVASRLDEVPASDPGPRLLDNLESPILDALPESDTEELICAAPFFDAGLTALDRLIDRLSPRHLSVLVESRTSVDGAKLVSRLREHGGDLGWISDEDRFHHGKLIEWADGGGRWTLTGSPNLSRPALLEPTAEGGNCELGLLSRVERSRAPLSEDLPAQDALLLRFAVGEDAKASGLLLLAAIGNKDIVHLTLNARLEQPGRVQRYDSGSDGWRKVADLLPGHDGYDIPIEVAPPTQALRILLDDGTASNQVFVTDLSRVLRPQMEAVGKVRLGPEEVARFGLGSKLLADIEALRPHLLEVGALVPIGDGDRDGREPVEEVSEGPRARPAPNQDLEDYLAACDPVLGREMTDFALILPAVPGLGNSFDEDAAGFAEELDDETGEAGDSEDPPHAPDLGETLSELPDHDRERWRRWIEKLVARSARYPTIVRTLALRSVLDGISEEIWVEEAAVDVLTKAAKALAARGDDPTEEERAAAGSLGAVAAVLIRALVDRISVRDEDTLRYEEVGGAVSPFLAHREPSQIEDLTDGIEEPEFGVGWVDACAIVADEILEPRSGAERAVQLLEEERGIAAEVAPGGQIELLEQLPARVESLLFLSQGLAGETGPLVALGTAQNGIKAIAIWRAPYLVIEKRSAGQWGSLYRLPDSLSPFHYTDFDRDLPRPLASWMGEESPPELALELLGCADCSAA
jgi:hypothetical protein